jgi:hypothetical protein
MAEAMAALWTVQFHKKVGFFEVVFEGDVAHVVTEINSAPPHLSKSGYFVESICQEIHNLQTAMFIHVHIKANMAAHMIAKHPLDCKEEGVSRRIFIFLFHILFIENKFFPRSCCI